jgi:hypothetical protein
MGKLIVFYVPANFTPPPVEWIPASEKGKVLAFQYAVERKSA